MSGVPPESVARFGSAPPATRMRIASTSLDLAARQNGVAPLWSTQLRSWDVGLNQSLPLTRAFGFAPPSRSAWRSSAEPTLSWSVLGVGAQDTGAERRC